MNSINNRATAHDPQRLPSSINDRMPHQLRNRDEQSGEALSPGNSVDLLIDGPAAQRAMLDAIDLATHHIHLEIYIYKSIAEGEPGNTIARALSQKASKGVEVCLLYDPAGSRKTSHSFFKGLEKHGVKVLEYNPVNPLNKRTGWRPNQRDHRKLLIVDGRIAVMGGIDISKHYSKDSYRRVDRHEINPRAGGWRDTDVRIEGPAVAQLQNVFLDTWRRQNGPPLTGDYFPQISECGNRSVRILRAKPGELPNEIHDAYRDAIIQARDHIRITNAYFMPDREIEQALIEAARAGVEVTLILSGFSDFKIMVYGQHHFYTKLLRAGVKIFERRHRLLHVKTAVIDNCWSTVGSYNLDPRSYLHEEEVNAVIFGEEFAQRMEAAFQDDLQQSVEINRNEWERRSWLQRLMESLVYRFRYWL